MESISGKNSYKGRVERKEILEGLENNIGKSEVKLGAISLMISVLSVRYVMKPSVCFGVMFLPNTTHTMINQFSRKKDF